MRFRIFWARGRRWGDGGGWDPAGIPPSRSRLVNGGIRLESHLTFNWEVGRAYGKRFLSDYRGLPTCQFTCAPPSLITLAILSLVSLLATGSSGIKSRFQWFLIAITAFLCASKACICSDTTFNNCLMAPCRKAICSETDLSSLSNGRFINDSIFLSFFFIFFVSAEMAESSLEDSTFPFPTVFFGFINATGTSNNVV